MARMGLGASRVALLIAGVAFSVSVAVAQTGAPPPQPTFANPPFKNLKVFPQDIQRAQLLSNMKFFSQSLGVRCTFCHVGEEGKPLSTFDFASDAKAKKLTARAMLQMARKLNKDEFQGEMKITCFTCHRGSTKPLTEPPPPPAPTTVPPPAPASQ